MTRYAAPFGAYEITPVPGQPQIAHCHGFFVRHDRRGEGLALALKLEQNAMLLELGYDYATCTVDAQNERQQKVLKKAGWYKISEFQNSKTGGTTLIYGWHVAQRIVEK